VRLVVDANILVGELLRERGRTLVADPYLELFIASRAWEETRYELRRRVRFFAERRGMEQRALQGLLDLAVAAAERHVVVIGADEYSGHENEARQRIPRDPDDWPTVALALMLEADIWTADGDFLGCGVATWTTETLLTRLQSH
jgi:predicted nucleic acid-binding protein